MIQSKLPDSFSGKTRKHLMRILNRAWEDEAVLSTTLQNFLGQNTGPSFQSIYRLFGDHYRQIDQWLGELADRTRALGATLGEGAEEVMHATRRAMGPVAESGPADRDMVDKLLAQHEGIANRLRRELPVAGAEDAGTAALLNRLIAFHEDTAWMLRMLVGGAEVPGKAR